MDLEKLTQAYQSRRYRDEFLRSYQQEPASPEYFGRPPVHFLDGPLAGREMVFPQIPSHYYHPHVEGSREVLSQMRHLQTGYYIESVVIRVRCVIRCYRRSRWVSYSWRDHDWTRYCGIGADVDVDVRATLYVARSAPEPHQHPALRELVSLFREQKYRITARPARQGDTRLAPPDDWKECRGLHRLLEDKVMEGFRGATMSAQERWTLLQNHPENLPQSSLRMMSLHERL